MLSFKPVDLKKIRTDTKKIRLSKKNCDNDEWLKIYTKVIASSLENIVTTHVHIGEFDDYWIQIYWVTPLRKKLLLKWLEDNNYVDCTLENIINNSCDCKDCKRTNGFWLLTIPSKNFNFD